LGALFKSSGGYLKIGVTYMGTSGLNFLAVQVHLDLLHDAIAVPLSNRYRQENMNDGWCKLHYNGFTVVQQYGNWDGSPIINESELMIMVCTRA
jgi:hypothetical protein